MHIKRISNAFLNIFGITAPVKLIELLLNQNIQPSSDPGLIYFFA